MGNRTRQTVNFWLFRLGVAGTAVTASITYGIFWKVVEIAMDLKTAFPEAIPDPLMLTVSIHAVAVIILDRLCIASRVLYRALLKRLRITLTPHTGIIVIPSWKKR